MLVGVAGVYRAPVVQVWQVDKPGAAIGRQPCGECSSPVANPNLDVVVDRVEGVGPLIDGVVEGRHHHQFMTEFAEGTRQGGGDVG